MLAVHSMGDAMQQIDFSYVHQSSIEFDQPTIDSSMFDDVETSSDSFDDGFWDSKSPLSATGGSCSPDPFEPLMELDELEQPSTFADTCSSVFEDFDLDQFLTDVAAFSCAPTSAAVCDCTALKRKCSSSSSFADVSPLLRDCMWSGTSGLVPLVVSADGKPCVPLVSGVDGSGSDFSCRTAGHQPESCSICTSCVSQTSISMCVDPKTVFPYPECRQQQQQTAISAVSRQDDEMCRTSPSSSSRGNGTSYVPVYDPDSETSAYSSAYSSAVSDEELDEIDVVSIPSSSQNSISCSSRLSSPTSCPSPVTTSHSADRREMLVLPASESVSAQVAAMHNYSSTRCRPTAAASAAAPSSSSSSSSSSALHLSKHSLQTIKRKYSNVKRLAITPKGRNRHHAVAATYSGSDSSEDSWANGDNEDDRCRRAQHNVMERRRRHHLKGNFFRLRDVIPDIAGDGRVSKVAILCRARDYIGRLTSSDKALQTEYDKLAAVQSKLKWQLSLVQREQRLATVGTC